MSALESTDCRVTSLLDGRILYVFLGAVFSKQYLINAIGPFSHAS